MKFEATIEKFPHNSLGYDYHVKVPTKIFEAFQKISTERRIVCTIKDYFYQCAFWQKEGIQYIMFSKDLRKKLNLDLGDVIELQIEKDESKYGAPISEEMIEVLHQDPEGSELFHQLTIGTQRSIIFLISKFKSSQLRIERRF